MKKAILFLAVSILSLSAISQAKPGAAHCTATTKAGQPCKGNQVKESTLCFVHKPGPTCGAQTKTGQPCQMKVKAAGAKCHHHSK